MRRPWPVHRPLTRLRSVALLVTAMAAAGSLVAAPAFAATSAATSRSYRVLQMNLCHSGLNTLCYTGPSAIQEARDVIAATRPDVVTLNEICHGDLEELASLMDGGHRVFASALRPDGTPVRCTDGDVYGNGIVFRAVGGTVSFARLYAAQAGEWRVYACAEFPDVIGCATHLSTNGDVALKQCREALGMLRGRGAGAKPAFLSGDINLRRAPWSVPHVGECESAPFLREGDGYVQHVFAAGMGYRNTQVIPMRYTDHPALLVTLAKP